MKKILLSILSLTSLSFAAQAQIPTDSLICHYSFSNTFNDQANSNHGTNSGATFAADRFGNTNNAIYLDGNSSVDFGDIDLLTPYFSISFWLNYEPIATGLGYRILSKRSVCNSGNFIDIQVSTTNIGMECYSGTNNSANAAAGGTASSNTWHHVTFIVDNSTQQTLKYLDNVLVSTKNWSSPMGSIDNSASFGSSISPCVNGSSILKYKGLLDDTRVYSRALTQAEVTELYNEPNPSVGINENALNNQITVYPNPTSSELTVTAYEQIEKINIMDLTGKTVKTIVRPNHTVDVSSLTKGMYFLQVHTEKGMTSKRFIKE